MARFNAIGIKKVWRRRRLSRRQPRQFFGEKGWLWNEPILENSFTDIDNVPANVDPLCSGLAFQAGSASLGGQASKTIVLRRIILDVFVSVVTEVDALFPFTAYDVGLVKFESQSSALTGPLPIDLQGIQLTTNNRVLAHERVWAGRVPGTYAPSEGEQPFSTVMATNRVRFDFKPNLPLTENETLGLVLSQCDSELYTDGTSALCSGYFKAYAQIK